MSAPKVTHADAMTFMVSWWIAVKQQRQRILPATPTVALQGSRKADTYMFVWSAHNLRTAAELVHRSVPADTQAAVRKAIDAFDAAAPDVRKLRNALSHFDAFVYGEGRLQRGLPAAHFGVYQVDHGTDFELAISLAPGGPILRLSVEATIDAANALFRSVGRAVDHLPMPTLADLASDTSG
jgi:hypothetical protein